MSRPQKIAWTTGLILGAALLTLCLSGCRHATGARSVSAPPLPPIVARAVSAAPSAPVYYFAATDTDSKGSTSGYSVELVWTNSVGTNMVTLAWEPPPPWTYPITNYTVLWGGSSRAYTNQVLAGTNLTVTATLTLPKTNRLFTLTLQRASSILGPWTTLTNWPTLSVTNPVGDQFYRMNIDGTRY